MSFEVALTERQYRSHLFILAHALVRDRGGTISEVVVTNETGDRISLFLQHSDLYVVGIDFGSGRFHFEDTPQAGPGWRALEFSASYAKQGGAIDAIELQAWKLQFAVTSLAHHAPRPGKSDIVGHLKEGLFRLIFAIAEALRFNSVQDDFLSLLGDTTRTLKIGELAGGKRPWTQWASLSDQLDWRSKGVRIRHGDSSTKAGRPR